jgi:aminoglycoside 6-adenylyltransferase
VGESSSSDWIVRLQRWAEGDPDIRVALLVGSQARTRVPADALSDIDLALFAIHPERFLRDESWVALLGPYWTTHLEGNALETGEERRVLFQDGQDVDFAVFPAEALKVMTADPRAVAVLRRGFRPLVNRESAQFALPPDEAGPLPPTDSEFSNLANDFWFHLVWTAKKLRRGETLTALEATNGYLLHLLIRAARWHSVACGPSGQDVWHGPRFFETWADPRVLAGLPDTVARYDPRSIAGSLRAHRALFSWLSDELADWWGLPSPVDHRSEVSSYLDRLLEPVG